MTVRHNFAGFTLLEVLVTVALFAVLISISQNIRIGGLTSYSEQTLFTRNQQTIKNMTWHMAIAQDSPVTSVALISCGGATISIGAGGVVKPAQLNCDWGKISIDKAGTIRRVER